MSLGLAVATDIANASLTYYVRGDAFLQTLQDKPLVRTLTGAQESFPGGKDNISYPVQGAFMSSTAGFFAGYTGDDQLAFKQAANLLRAEYPWKEVHAGLIITWSELKQDGVTVRDSMKTSDHSRTELIRLTSILRNRLDDYGESWSRAFNDMLWRNGAQDAKAIPGVLGILTNTPAVGNTGSLNRATYSWWRHRTNLAIVPSEANQTLAKTLRSDLRQLRRFGGRPSVALCGSSFLDALDSEVQAKGTYTQEGFVNKGKNDIGMAEISLRGLGTFQYDPTLDDLGLGKYCYVIDTRHLKLHPMEGEDNKVLSPERPYDYLVFLRSMTYTGAIGSNQLNCHGIYSVA